MGFLHPSFPPPWTLPGHEGVFGTWGTPPKLAPLATTLANAATSSHPSRPRRGHSPQLSQPGSRPAGPFPWPMEMSQG